MKEQEVDCFFTARFGATLSKNCNVYAYRQQTQKELTKIKKIVTALLMSFVITALAACASNDTSPNDTAISLKNALTFDDYEKFQSLFSEGKKGIATKALFEQLKDINSSRADFRSYTVITLDNGEMLLVNLTPNKEQAIQSITVIPEEHKELFSE
ncbi:hypothetical protein FHS18_004350 [Paenibacillus phyllosphaerae]|uniref:Uncharacterized protein n=1 Tax=Paenibacillus phyllosphaerae TaxID=274593 RepID=A0A7W5B0N5_9BACL|nr:hypothetical protein [Paenibacillus phyllosphaerae]MBB3112264.1 hypothetical protein [Paenibacillus phyllosphaerae]